MTFLLISHQATLVIKIFSYLYAFSYLGVTSADLDSAVFFKSKNVSILNFRPLIGGIKIITNLYSVILEERKKTNSFNPLTTNDELSPHENLTFLWTWILRWVPRSLATHASNAV